ncbi:MAG: hypothetical protein JXR70_08415 [Spirochaetales bacterium]|nr:hypothetical protein [Spirochaetales bacterium]
MKKWLAMASIPNASLTRDMVWREQLYKMPSPSEVKALQLAFLVNNG